MGIFDLFGKKEAPIEGKIYGIRIAVHPMRLTAYKSNAVTLTIDLSNNFTSSQLTSVIITLPKTLGFDQSALSNSKEIRLGDLAPGEVKNIKLDVWSIQRTKPGDYKLEVYVISHYRNYAYVLNEIKKEFRLRVV
ncbi:Uncharacterised protein [uncultured archaeon]|nr:Uncharacterised protein [uncultured archaeon]